MRAQLAEREPGLAAGPTRARLGPDVVMLAIFATLLLPLVLLARRHLVLRASTLLLPGLVAPGIIAVQLARHRPRRQPIDRAQLIRVTLRDWLPLVGVALVFDNLEAVTGLIRAQPIDATLYRLDLWLFGCEPTVAVQALHHPLLTDWMAIAYGSFLMTPMLLAIALCLAERNADFRELSTAVMLLMGFGFVLFVVFPAGPPRYFPPLRDGVFMQPLPSLLGLNDMLQARWDHYDPLLVRSAFPSLHCAYALTTLIYAWRFGDVLSRRRHAFFAVVLPLQLSLVASTIYLRHHWVPDCVAGFTVAAAACALAPRLRRRSRCKSEC